MPARGALFGNAAVRSRNLVEFRAGKMTMVGNRVIPDKRKGLLYVHRSEDSLMHFCWMDRVTGRVEDDLIIFPDECEFKPVPQCTTGRVYVLKFRASARKFFVWVQEPKCDKDEENANRINEVLNNPPGPGARSGGESDDENVLNLMQAMTRSGGESDDENVLNLMQAMTRDQLMHMVAGIHHTGDLASMLEAVLPLAARNSPSTTESDSSDGESAQLAPRNPVLLSNLQRVLSHLGLLASGTESDSDGTGSSVESKGSGSSVESESSGSSVESESSGSSAQNQPGVSDSPENSDQESDSLNYSLLSEVQNFFASVGVPPEARSGSNQAAVSSSALERESLYISRSADADQRSAPTPGSNPSSGQPQKGVRRCTDDSDNSEEPPNKRKKTDGGEKDDEVEDEDEDL